MNPTRMNSIVIHSPKRKQHKLGFSLLELLVAMIILVIAMSIAIQAFRGTLRAWKRGGEVIDGIEHGDYVITELSSALNSILYFYNGNNTYTFTLEDGGDDDDIISFVTTSSAFLPEDSPYRTGPHRLELSIDQDDDGNPALFALAMPPISLASEDSLEEFKDEYDEEPELACRNISGLGIEFWDAEEEEWTEEWEEENAVPERILITIWVTPNDPKEEDMQFQRIIEVPVFDSVEQRISSPSSTSSTDRSRTSSSAPAGTIY